MKTLFAFLLIWPALAGAQISYTTPADAALKPLDGATVAGKIHVQLVQTTGAPWTLCLDGKCNTENTAPYVLANEAGDTSDTNVWDTTKSAAGAHVVTAKNASQALTASFTVANGSAPLPPTTSPPTGSGSAATVRWTPPVTYGDGSTLADLAGFRIYFGQAADALSTSIAIANPAATSGIVSPLGAGTWYFAVTAYTASGAESLDSQVVSLTLGGTSLPPPPPAPVDCVVSAWSDWTGGAWNACSGGTQMRQEARARNIVTQPANGGASCPALTETRTASQSCVMPDVWVVAANGTQSTRPVYEAVLPLTGTALVRGNQEGAAKIGAPCGAEIFLQSRNSYRTVTDADAGLTSPTYKGRQHVAICTRQQ